MNSETKKFHSILDDEWKSNAEKYPEWATRLGDNRFNDKLNDASYETIINRQEKATKLLDKIKADNMELLNSIDTTGKLDENNEIILTKIIEDLKK